MLAFALSVNAKGSAGTVMPLPPVTQTINTASTAGVAVPTGGTVAAPNVNQSIDFGSVVPFGSANAIRFGKDGNIQVEQTEVLDQLANYVNHLHAIRRNNEGSDSADAPGYSMNLMRIPVSVLPGQNTKRGYAAEITITAESYLGDQLLPMAFREFVMNDLIDQLALPFAQYLNSDPATVKTVVDVIEGFDSVFKVTDSDDSDILPVMVPDLAIPNDTDAIRFVGNSKQNPNKVYYYFDDAIYLFSPQQARAGLNYLLASTSESSKFIIQSLYQNSQNLTQQPGTATLLFDNQVSNDILVQAWSDISSVADDHVKSGIGSSTSSATRRVTLPFPPSQLFKNFGTENLTDILAGAYSAIKQDLVNQNVVHISDLQGLMREEVGAAYELLSKPSMHPVWEMDYAPSGLKLAELVRVRNIPQLNKRRQQFDAFLENTGWGGITSALAWCLYVDAHLLNDRLNRDIIKTYGTTPNSPPTAQWMAFHEPNPAPEACQAFAEYVKIRWPIHVFALDPAINEQNIQDVRSIYRQMQMAVAVGYATGNIGISGALQAMRKLQRDRATVDLNRVAIGFGHGDDTFGWRFAPRFQTPPVESNSTVFFRDLIGGGPTDKQLERSQAIEPGVRECVALIIMPSFVPHVTLHTRSNWYQINCPTRTGDSMHDTVHYSRAIKQMECNAQMCCQCAHLYRNGEVERLLKRVHQIDRKLAVQTLECQVPIENHLGGHELLTAGRRELAPELNGWYGAPGYDSTRGTTLFLSGDSFSVTQSRLIVGNQPIKAELLSRQVMQVTLPPGLSVMRDRKLDDALSENFLGYVDAQIATPYGVSGHMLIPVLRPNLSGTAVQVTTIRNNTLQVTLNLTAPVIAPATTPSTDRTKFTSGKFAAVSTGINLLQLDIPKGDGLQQFASIQAFLFTAKDSDRLINIPAITLKTADGGASFTADDGELARQFGGTPGDSTLLGGIIGNHVAYLLQNGQAPVGKTIKYQLGVGLSAATNPSTQPLTKTSGAIYIEVALKEPTP